VLVGGRDGLLEVNRSGARTGRTEPCGRLLGGMEVGLCGHGLLVPFLLLLKFELLLLLKLHLPCLCLHLSMKLRLLSLRLLLCLHLCLQRLLLSFPQCQQLLRLLAYLMIQRRQFRLEHGIARAGAGSLSSTSEKRRGCSRWRWRDGSAGGEWVWCGCGGCSRDDRQLVLMLVEGSFAEVILWLQLLNRSRAGQRACCRCARPRCRLTRLCRLRRRPSLMRPLPRGGGTGVKDGGEEGVLRLECGILISEGGDHGLRLRERLKRLLLRLLLLLLQGCILLDAPRSRLSDFLRWTAGWTRCTLRAATGPRCPLWLRLQLRLCFLRLHRCGAGCACSACTLAGGGR
jgi:hypothetical protein